MNQPSVNDVISMLLRSNFARLGLIDAGLIISVKSFCPNSHNTSVTDGQTAGQQTDGRQNAKDVVACCSSSASKQF